MSEGNLTRAWWLALLVGLGSTAFTALTATDLMAALRASLEASNRGRGRGRSASASSGNGELDSLSREELYELAREADIPGRSTCP